MENLDIVLSELNLTESEIKIYKFLLDYGKSSVGDISKKTLIHRRNVYDCLDRLIHKGFVGYLEENGVKMYSLSNPQGVMQRLEARAESFGEILPNLLEKFNVQQEKVQTLFFTGKDGLRQVFEDQLLVGQEILVSATSVDVKTILKYFFEGYNRERREKEINVRMIFDESVKKSSSELVNIPLCEARFVKDFNKSPMSQYIYGNNVAIVVWSAVPIAILIRQKEVADGFRDGFEAMWSMVPGE